MLYYIVILKKVTSLFSQSQKQNNQMRPNEKSQTKNEKLAHQQHPDVSDDDDENKK